MGYLRGNLKGFYKRTTVFYVLLIKRLIEKTRPGTRANFLYKKVGEEEILFYKYFIRVF